MKPIEIILDGMKLCEGSLKDYIIVENINKTTIYLDSKFKKEKDKINVKEIVKRLEKVRQEKILYSILPAEFDKRYSSRS